MKLLPRIARIRIGDFQFESGDGNLLPNITITLGENERSSNGQFSIYDPGLLIGAEFMKMSMETGGIITPPDLLKGKDGAKNESNGSASLGNFGGGNAAQTEQAIVAECLRQGITDDGQIAYILATAKHESGNFVYYEEIASGSAYEGRSDLGNTQPGDGVRFKGRGLVQITGRTNYQKFSQILGQDFVANPQGMADPKVAVFTLVYGMKNGTFTGATIGDYVGNGKQDFYNARRIVNGTDRADLIAGYASEYLKRVPQLKNSSGSNIQPAMAPQGSPTPTPPTQAEPPKEESIKGTEIIIELGYRPDNLIAFHFIHTGTNCSKGKGVDTTQFEGKTVRWLLTRVTQTTSFQDVNLRQVADLTASKLGITVEMEGQGQKYEHLDLSGKTPFELLSREAKNIGFRVADDKNKLILEPEARPKFSNFVVDEETLISVQFGDQARAGHSSPSTPVSKSDGASGETKSAIDRQSGRPTMLQMDSMAGTGKPAGSQGTVTGSAAPSVGGIIKQEGNGKATSGTPTPGVVSKPPEFRKNELKSGNTTITDQITIERTEDSINQKVTTVTTTRTTENTITNSGATQTVKTTIETKVATPKGTTITTEVTAGGTTTSTTTETSDIDQFFTEKKADNPELDQFGLPKQPPGIIDLEDGRAEGQKISDESKRVKGYESVATLVTTEEVLQIVPGEIVGFSPDIVPDPFDREWRVGEVRHDWASGTTTLSFYTPQKPPEGSSATAASPEVNATAPNGKLQNPMPGTDRGTPFDPSGVIRGRPHNGIDLAGATTGNKILAAESGTVTDVVSGCRVGDSGCGGGYGNLVEISHEGEWSGWKTLYAHLSSVSVSQGQKVQKGQVIGIEGDTGASAGDHLHFEVSKGGQRVDPEIYICPPPSGTYGQGASTPIRSKC